MPTRRGFFKIMGLSACIPFLRFGSAEPRRRSIELLEVFVAGFQYHAGMQPEVLRDLRVGRELLLVREPENPYDELAVAVRTRAGLKLGYIPRACNEIPASLADQGLRLRAAVAELDAEAPTWERLAISVWLEV